MSEGPFQANQWTWAATIGVLQWFTGILIGGGGIWTISKSIALLIRTNADKTEKEEAREQARTEAVRQELMAIVAHQTKRVDTLEATIAEERVAHVKEISLINSEHAAEVRELKAEIAGLRKIIVQWQVSTGRVIDIAAHAPAAAEMNERLLAQIDEAERNAQ